MGRDFKKRTYIKNLRDIEEHGVFKELKDQCDSREVIVSGIAARNTGGKHSREGQASHVKDWGSTDGF